MRMTNPRSKHIVVYADDDLDDLDFVERAFSDYTQTVELVSFPHAKKALEFLQSLAEQNICPCLIILDINMPEINGKDLLVQLRSYEHYASTPIVLFSTSSSPWDIRFAETHRAVLITKPITYDQMDNIMEEFIQHCSEEVRNAIKRN
jgi:CheY-like chemotaxis protein